MTEEDCEWTLVGNPVLDFFMEDENSKKMLSTRTLAKRIGLRQKDVFLSYSYLVINLNEFNQSMWDIMVRVTRVFKLKADI